MTYNKITDAVLAEIIAIAGDQNVLTGQAELEKYSHDELKIFNTIRKLL